MLRAVLGWVGTVLVAAVMAASPTCARAPEVVRPTTPEIVLIGGQLQQLVDPSGRLTLSDVLARPDDFAAAGVDWPTYGIGRGAAWTRIRLDLSADPLRETRRIQFDALHPDEASFFVVDDSGAVLRQFIGGLDHPESATARKFSMSLAGLPEHFTLYGRITSHHISRLVQTLTSTEQEIAEEMEAERALGPAFGAMALAALYCLLLWAHL